MDIFDSRFISRERVKKTIDELTSVKNYLGNFKKPLDNLIKEGESIKGILNILGFFKIPGSDQVISKLEKIKEYSQIVSRDMNNINLDKQIGDLYELYLKMDSLNKYIKKLEEDNEKLRKK